MKTYKKLPVGLPTLPILHKDYSHWELKGWGWKSNKKERIGVASSGDRGWAVQDREEPPLSDAMGIETLYYILAVKSPKKKVIVNKKGWIAFSEQKPTKADLPIKVTYADGETSSDGADYDVCKIWPLKKPESESAQWTHWMRDDTPAIPKPESGFETWWAAQSKTGKHKSECKAAWDAAINSVK